jgi:nicotinate-nucleotide--dimethylbenzimidazole phosphoribosyltransferase
LNNNNAEKLKQVCDRIRPLDRESMALAREHQDRLTKPPGSLGRLEEISIHLAGIMRTPKPRIRDKVIVTMAGDHGVVGEGVTRYPQEVTAQMVGNFLAGGAGVNVLAGHVEARVVIVNMGVASILPAHPALVDKQIAGGTRNMARGPAMTREQALRSLTAGIEVIEEEADRGLDILGVGEMGIGNTTAAAAVAAAITGAPVEAVTGRGTGLDDEGLARKREIIRRVIAVNRPDGSDGLQVLSRVGGFEIGGMAGAMLASAARGVPVVVDGFISAAAALIAWRIAPGVREYMIASHRSAEAGHGPINTILGLEPLLDLGMRLGEGTGAALAISIVEASARVLTEMATFDEAGVTGAGT